MKFLKILAVLTILVLPCLYYNPSGLVSLGRQVANVLEISYLSLFDDLSKIGS